MEDIKEEWKKLKASFVEKLNNKWAYRYKNKVVGMRRTDVHSFVWSDAIFSKNSLICFAVLNPMLMIRLKLKRPKLNLKITSKHNSKIFRQLINASKWNQRQNENRINRFLFSYFKCGHQIMATSFITWNKPTDNDFNYYCVKQNFFCQYASNAIDVIYNLK